MSGCNYLGSIHLGDGFVFCRVGELICKKGADDASIGKDREMY